MRWDIDDAGTSIKALGVGPPVETSTFRSIPARLKTTVLISDLHPRTLMPWQ